MTRVRLYRASNGLLKGYEVKGHTGFAESGQDIVCAALSFLSITCANALEKIAGQTAQVSQSDGYLRVMTVDDNDQAQTILKLFELGITDLADSYPKHIRLTNQEPQH